MPTQADSAVATRKLRSPYRRRLTNGSARVRLVATQPTMPNRASPANVMMKF
jgi:hypothetical protein